MPIRAFVFGLCSFYFWTIIWRIHQTYLFWFQKMLWLTNLKPEQYDLWLLHPHTSDEHSFLPSWIPCHLPNHLSPAGCSLFAGSVTRVNALSSQNCRASAVTVIISVAAWSCGGGGGSVFVVGWLPEFSQRLPMWKIIGILLRLHINLRTSYSFFNERFLFTVSSFSVQVGA